MIENLKNIMLFLMLIYSIIISVLFWTKYNNLENYQKDKLDFILLKEKELSQREGIIVDKEICFRELTKLKTINDTALDVLKSYKITSPNQQSEELKTMSTT